MPQAHLSYTRMQKTYCHPEPACHAEFSSASHGFTLAEVLITLGIIGVVAAMTLPALVQKQNEKATVTKLKKFMSVMNSAVTMSINENGPIDSWNLTTSVHDEETDSTTEETNAAQDYFIRTYILPYVKHIKYCPIDDLRCSLRYERHSLDGTRFGDFWEFVMLADGSVIPHFWIRSTNCSEKLGSSKMLSNICGEMAIDINGRKKPNKTGEDVFYFYFTKYGVIPMGTAEQTSGFTFDNYCNKGKTDRLNGYGCAAWVMYNENLNYLYCNDLSWNGKKKCK